MKKFEIHVCIEVEIDDECVYSPEHGVHSIAENYAQMAVNYKSIGASCSWVECIVEKNLGDKQ